MKQVIRWVGVLVVFLCVSTSQSRGNENQGNDINNKANQAITGEVKTDRAEELRQKILGMLPQAKEGYSWVLFRGVALQRPIGWHEQMEGGSYCSSVESVPENGLFETGVTIQVIREVSNAYKMPPNILMAKYVVDLEEKEENFKLIMNPKSYGDVETLVYRYRNAPERMTPIIVHKYFQVSVKEDFINIITFETTEEKWDQYWNKQGIDILGQVVGIPYF